MEWNSRVASARHKTTASRYTHQTPEKPGAIAGRPWIRFQTGSSGETRASSGLTQLLADLILPFPLLLQVVCADKVSHQTQKFSHRREHGNARRSRDPNCFQRICVPREVDLIRVRRAIDAAFAAR